MKNWLTELSDDELEELLTSVFVEVGRRAHARSHPAPAESEAA